MSEKNRTDLQVMIPLIIITLICSSILFIDSITPRGFLDWFFYLPVIIFAAVKFSKPYIVAFGVIAFLLTIAGFFLSPAGISIEIAAINRIIGLLVIWMTASLLYNQAKEKESKEEIIQQFKIVLDKMPTGIAYFDTNGSIIMVNKKFERILGYEPDELFTKNILEFTHPDYRKEFLEMKERMILDLLKPGYLTGKLIKKDGNEVSANISLNIIDDSSSKCFIAFILENPDEKNKEEDKIFNLFKDNGVLLNKIPYY